MMEGARSARWPSTVPISAGFKLLSPARRLHGERRDLAAEGGSLQH